MKRFTGHLLIGLTVVLAGCSTYSDDDLSTFDVKIKNHLEKEDIKCERSESGLYFNILEEGEGDYIQFQDRVSFTYTGTLLDGAIFDNQQEPVEFAVADLIGAWKEIMLQIKKGAKVYLATPPQLAYGSNALDDIPANSVLIYEMDILDVK
ncbi:MAG: FKBP-type peptidyl-prolyl cis-trans isomerase FkpA [Flavobacteriaceae bacterium]|jgi:FKBP-type peptidyl-prolyl cis-trans isomerase FkpA